MLHTAAIYFDGISSVPQPIELTLDELQGQLVFRTSNAISNKWNIEAITFEHIGNTLEVRQTDNILALIKTEDADFISNFLNYLNKSGHLGWYHKFTHLSMRTYLILAAILVGLIVVSYLVIIPWMAEKAVSVIPRSYDSSIGQKYYKQFTDENSVDSAKTETLNEFARQLNLNNELSIRFSVIRSSTVNAFALPDGHIVVFTGLIDLMKNYDELAGLIGHEVTHVNNRHSMKMLCRDISGSIFVAIVFNNSNGISTLISNNAQRLQSLSYSRRFEQEADEEGTKLMIQNHINPLGMTRLFTRLKSEEKFIVPAFISTHPLTTDRIEAINKLISQLPHSNIKNPTLEELFIEIKNE